MPSPLQDIPTRGPLASTRSWNWNLVLGQRVCFFRLIQCLAFVHRCFCKTASKKTSTLPPVYLHSSIYAETDNLGTPTFAPSTTRGNQNGPLRTSRTSLAIHECVRVVGLHDVRMRAEDWVNGKSARKRNEKKSLADTHWYSSQYTRLPGSPQIVTFGVSPYSPSRQLPYFPKGSNPYARGEA